jgi:hypothetical protein
MSDEQLTYETATLIAEFIHAAVRPDWDVKGIVKALGDAREKACAGTVAVAAIVAAQNPGNRTPGVIPLTGPHWAVSGTTKPRHVVPPRNQTCGTCYLAEDDCRRRWFWDHEFESLIDARERKINEAEGVPKWLRERHNRQPAYIDGRPVNNVELP